MSTAPPVDMHEATRLTRLGRLAEAMAILRGEAASEPPAEGLRRSAGQKAPRFLDMLPPTTPGGAWTAPFATSPASTKHAASRAEGTTTPIAEGARFEAGTFSNAAGKRAYKLYVPSSYQSRPVPLIVMLHGCTQSPDDFAAGTRMNEVAEEQGFLVVYPAQAQSANASKCWNWFNAGDQQRDMGEPSLIAGVTRQVMAEFAVDPERVYVTGLSAGGAAAAVLGAAYPDLYAAIGVHSGLARGSAKDMASAFAAMSQGAAPPRVPDGDARPTIVFHGDRDGTVSPINADHVIAQSKAGARLRVGITRGVSPGGVSYQRTVHLDDNDAPVLEQWVLHGAGHAWSGGGAAGSYTDPRGPDASREMARFFLQHRLARWRASPGSGSAGRE